MSTTGYRDAPATLQPFVVNANSGVVAPFKAATNSALNTLGSVLVGLFAGGFLGSRVLGLVAALMGAGRHDPFPPLAWVLGALTCAVTVVAVVHGRYRAAKAYADAIRQPDCTIRGDGLALILERGPDKQESYPIDSARRCLFANTRGDLAPAIELTRTDGHRLHLACTRRDVTNWPSTQTTDWNEFDVSPEIFQRVEDYLWREDKRRIEVSPELTRIEDDRQDVAEDELPQERQRER